MKSSNNFPLKRHSRRLPNAADFGVSVKNPDARWAWEIFGGHSMEQAYDVFTSNPVTYQEAFMFMSPVAFEYYFPVIDHYLREVSSEDELDDCQAAVLGAAIAAQLERRNSCLSSQVVAEISQLSSYVRCHLPQYSSRSEDRKEIDLQWRRVDACVSKFRPE